MGPCIIHKGAMFRDGYGSIHSNGKQWRAHRLAYTQAYGPIPKGLLVCHKCDIPLCVNPEHLFLGTNKQNAQDREQKGRGRPRKPKGILNPKAKLQEQDIIDIRNSNLNITELADYYTVEKSTIRRILRRETWKHL